MANRGYPLIRGSIFKTEFYQSPKGGGGGDIRLPPRNPKAHGARLIEQLDALLGRVQRRPMGERDPQASRELIAVSPKDTYDLAPASLGDANRDVRVLGVTETGTALLDAKDPDMVQLRRKIEAYTDSAKLTDKGAPKNAPAIAPIEEIRLASEVDLIGPRLAAAKIEPNVHRWFEIACRGGARSIEDSGGSRGQMHRQLAKLGVPPPQEFVATEQIVFFVRLTLVQLRGVAGSVDCVQEFDLAPPDVRDWLLFNEQPIKDIRSFALNPPPADAPSVVLLDTGIATGHPMLSKAILAAASVVPGDTSAEDKHGHGTRMAGVALLGDDVGLAVEAGKVTAPHWLNSVRLLTAPAKGSAAEENRNYWPHLTIAAVVKAEHQDPMKARPRVFTMATSYGVDIIEPTYWSHAVDRLAFNNGAGRLICIAIGNADVTDVRLIESYPTLNLEQKVQEPAQSANALTVGAYTAKTKVPPEAIYAASKAVAPAGGISPHTSAGTVAGLHGPDILMEGGNVAFDGNLPDSFVETLTTLTTGPEFLTKPLSRICMTSEATARAGGLAASIWAAEPGLQAATVRGLIVHSSAWTPTMLQQFPNKEERLAICGLGVPDPELALACARDRATVVFEDRMPNAVPTKQPKKGPTRAAGKTPTETKLKRVVKYFRLPVPENLLLDDPSRQVELRVTLSYFPEPNTFHQQVSRGLDLKWDMQGPSETWGAFQVRINKLSRGAASKPTSKSFQWDLGITRRSRGTVQSDRWAGPASFLAGNKHVAVVPVLGWWERRPALRELTMPFSLIVTVRAAGLDIYEPIRVAVENVVEVTT
jgi:hypothetical protein